MPEDFHVPTRSSRKAWTRRWASVSGWRRRACSCIEVPGSGGGEDDGRAHAAADAETRQGLAGRAGGVAVGEVGDETGARGADRMAHGDGPAIGIDAGAV